MGGMYIFLGIVTAIAGYGLVYMFIKKTREPYPYLLLLSVMAFAGYSAALIIQIDKDYQQNIESAVNSLKMSQEEHKPYFLSLDEENPFKDAKFTEENFCDALYYYDIQEPMWVMAQAKLESGYFASDLFLEKNNPFGLYDSRNNTYFSFNHWSESILAYRNMIQRPDRYKPEKHKDYGEYLEKMGYAEDKDYVNKLRKIMNRWAL